MPTGTSLGLRPWLDDLPGEDRGRCLARSVAGVVGGLRLHLSEHASVARDNKGQRFGSTDVNADRDVTHASSSAWAFKSSRA